MATGVYKTTKKDGSVYYRVSITYKNKHISIGSYDDEFLASAAYAIANDVLYKPGTYYIDKDMHTTSYNHIAAELSNNASLKSRRRLEQYSSMEQRRAGLNQLTLSGLLTRKPMDIQHISKRLHSQIQHMQESTMNL